MGAEAVAQALQFLNPGSLVTLIIVLYELRRLERRLAQIERELGYVRGFVNGVRECGSGGR